VLCSGQLEAYTLSDTLSEANVGNILEENSISRAVALTRHRCHRTRKYISMRVRICMCPNLCKLAYVQCDVSSDSWSCRESEGSRKRDRGTQRYAITRSRPNSVEKWADKGDRVIENLLYTFTPLTHVRLDLRNSMAFRAQRALHIAVSAHMFCMQLCTIVHCSACGHAH
jgi:hypothetical protein